jgi:hypothetical protein
VMIERIDGREYRQGASEQNLQHGQSGRGR